MTLEGVGEIPEDRAAPGGVVENAFQAPGGALEVLNGVEEIRRGHAPRFGEFQGAGEVQRVVRSHQLQGVLRPSMWTSRVPSVMVKSGVP